MSSTALSKRNFKLDTSYLSLPEKFYTRTNPEPSKNPTLFLFNHELAEFLELPKLDDYLYQEPLGGNGLLPGSIPFSQAYAGHQFGHFTMLGDGRAHVLGEQVLESGARYDVQLKGSGRTPYSRGGDGRATAQAMVREFIMSEAMHYLGIPTTRSLSVVLTGLPVFREEVNHGAVLTRVAASHIRVGTFEYAYYFLDLEHLKKLADYTIQRHFPEVKDFENPYLAFFQQVAKRQLSLILQWMRVGFIHGVMNTDNMSIPGETIDYGPCAFINFYSPSKVFSSIDTKGRYAFGNQPAIAQWNLACLGNALLPLLSIHTEEAVELAKSVLNYFGKEFELGYFQMMGSKIGIQEEIPSQEIKILIQDLLKWMEATQADYTLTFLAIEFMFIENLIQEKKISSEFPFVQQGLELWRENLDFQIWFGNWKDYLTKKNLNPVDVINTMKKVNPFTIPRNHIVERYLDLVRSVEILESSVNSIENYINQLKGPYTRQTEFTEYQLPPEGGDGGYKTFCNT